MFSVNSLNSVTTIFDQSKNYSNLLCSHLLCERPACQHSASLTHVRDRIFKLSLIHASVILSAYLNLLNSAKIPFIYLGKTPIKRSFHKRPFLYVYNTLKRFLQANRPKPYLAISMEPCERCTFNHSMFVSVDDFLKQQKLEQS